MVNIYMLNHTNNLVDQTNLAIVWESHLAGTNFAVRKSAPTPFSALVDVASHTGFPVDPQLSPFKQTIDIHGGFYGFSRSTWNNVLNGTQLPGAKRREFSGMIPLITNNNHPSNPIPIHSLLYKHQ